MGFILGFYTFVYYVSLWLNFVCNKSFFGFILLFLILTVKKIVLKVKAQLGKMKMKTLVVPFKKLVLLDRFSVVNPISSSHWFALSFYSLKLFDILFFFLAPCSTFVKWSYASLSLFFLLLGCRRKGGWVLRGWRYQKVLSSILDEMQMTQLCLAWHQDHLAEKLLTLENDPFNPTDMNGRALTGLAMVREWDRCEKRCFTATL